MTRINYRPRFKTAGFFLPPIFTLGEISGTISLMPISKSAKKSLRVSRTKMAINRHRKALIKEALKTVTAENTAAAIAMVDKGAKWGIFHPNKAARLKSRLSKTVRGSIKSAKTKVAAPAKKTATKSAAPKKSAKK
jgi:small subunit ribosomal protein S20